MVGRSLRLSRTEWQMHPYCSEILTCRHGFVRVPANFKLEILTERLAMLSVLSMPELKFPKDFLWGAATARHQVEGDFRDAY